MSTITVLDPRTQTAVDPGVAFYAQPGAPVAIKNRGTWSATSAYLVNDSVHRKSGASSSKTYTCILANTGQDPASAPTYWTALNV